MAFVRKFEGEWLVCTTNKGRTNTMNLPPEQVKKSYIIKHAGDRTHIRLGNYAICTPKELAGKRVRVKVEIIED